MAYQVLARKYRPQLFSDVIGQDHVTRTLLNALSQNRIAHGYIFSGHRGIGKTTIARILAAALNCSTPVGSPERPTQEPCRICVNCREISSASRQENSIFEESHSFDVEEIDAATNRGIDDARLLTAKIQTRPTNKSKYKIIILDEAHQITDAAWNALLKTLEEPPEWAIFMFATTQPEDIPQTIRSRCQHFSFHAVKLDDIVGQLRFISTMECIAVDEATLTLLAEAGDGSMRDALSIMDQAIASAPVVDGHPHLEIAQVRALMGSVSNVVYEQILEAIHDNNSADVLAITGRLLDAGNGAPQLARQFVRYLRNAIVAKVTHLIAGAEATGISADLLQISTEERNRAARSAALFTEEELSRFLSIMLRTFDELGYRQEQRFHLELGLLKLVHLQRLVPIEELLSQLVAKPPINPSVTATSRSASVAAAAPEGPRPTATKATAPAPQTFAAAPSALRAPIVTPPGAAKPVMDSGFGEGGPARTEGSLALAAERASAPASVPAEIYLVNNAASVEDSSIDLDRIQALLVAALGGTKGQQSASEQIEESTLSLNGTTLEIQTTLTKTMLPVVINGESERILKAALRDANSGSLMLKLLPGVPEAASAPKKPRQAASGSAAELAQKHPMVQKAREMFSADISNVIDLRDKG
jgi:DNA polymerase-3 subunit gamma/tau